MSASFRGNLLTYPGMSLLADTLDDVERVRIATENRLRALTRDEADSDGTIRGLGFSKEHPIVAQTAAQVSLLNELEKNAIKNLEQAIKETVFYPWVQEQKGVGSKQAGRLLAAVGDPYWMNRYEKDEKTGELHLVEERPRTVGELWAYCGYSVVGGTSQARTKGQVSNWSSDARKRAYLVAASCIKSNGHYREVYDDARAQYAEATHLGDCKRCGPSGKPALAGSPLSAGHQHARSLRRISKEVLKDLWKIGRDHYEAQGLA